MPPRKRARTITAQTRTTHLLAPAVTFESDPSSLIDQVIARTPTVLLRIVHDYADEEGLKAQFRAALSCDDLQIILDPLWDPITFDSLPYDHMPSKLTFHCVPSERKDSDWRFDAEMLVVDPNAPFLPENIQVHNVRMNTPTVLLQISKACTLLSSIIEEVNFFILDLVLDTQRSAYPNALSEDSDQRLPIFLEGLDIIRTSVKWRAIVSPTHHVLSLGFHAFRHVLTHRFSTQKSFHHYVRQQLWEAAIARGVDRAIEL